MVKQEGPTGPSAEGPSGLWEPDQPDLTSFLCKTLESALDPGGRGPEGLLSCEGHMEEAAPFTFFLFC